MRSADLTRVTGLVWMLAHVGRVLLVKPGFFGFLFFGNQSKVKAESQSPFCGGN